MAKEPRTGSAVKGNGFDEKLTRIFVSDIEKILDEMASKKGEYMAWCKGQRELIGEKFDAAKNVGIPKRELKEVIKIRETQNKLNRLIDADGEAEQAETIEMIRHALGDLADLPLGAAVVEKKTKGDAMADAEAKPSMN